MTSWRSASSARSSAMKLDGRGATNRTRATSALRDEQVPVEAEEVVGALVDEVLRPRRHLVLGDALAAGHEGADEPDEVAAEGVGVPAGVEQRDRRALGDAEAGVAEQRAQGLGQVRVGQVLVPGR